jgi:hypothetical protein
MKPLKWIPILCAAALVISFAAWMLARSTARSTRVPSLPAEVQASLKLYKQTEGPGRRGPAFEQLTVGLALVRQQGRDLSQSEIFDYLGPPDLKYAESIFGYRYTKSQPNDWVAGVMFDKEGKCTLIGWNAADSVVDRAPSSTTKPE